MLNNTTLQLDFPNVLNTKINFDMLAVPRIPQIPIVSMLNQYIHIIHTQTPEYTTSARYAN